jgi:alpha-ribazole phosphatase
MEIHLIRHTTPCIDKNVCYGQFDVLLKDTFEEEVRLVLEKLTDKADVIYTSPLTRCIKLAERIAQTFNLPVKEDDRLKEMNFGAWEMKRWDDIDKVALMKWMNDYQHERCPQGESYLDLIVRLKEFYNEINLKQYQSVVIVTHAGVIKSSLVILGELSLKDAMSIKVGFGSVLTMNSRALPIDAHS